MNVQECMSRNVQVCAPDMTVRDAARVMKDIDSGFLPIGEGDRLLGTLTDRDIAIRAVAEGKGPDTPVREVMSADVCYCFEDEDIDEVARNMGDIKVRRLPVVNREKRLVGVVSLGDISQTRDTLGSSGHALRGISEPGGMHSQHG